MMARSWSNSSMTFCDCKYAERLPQVYMMDKRLVDPRRPRTDKPTEAERQEGLARYSPQLQQLANLFASYNRQIPRLKGVTENLG